MTDRVGECVTQKRGKEGRWGEDERERRAGEEMDEEKEEEQEASYELFKFE